MTVYLVISFILGAGHSQLPSSCVHGVKVWLWWLQYHKCLFSLFPLVFLNIKCFVCYKEQNALHKSF